ncbi:MAG: flavodoxin [Mangrovibacterium sp.]
MKTLKTMTLTVMSILIAMTSISCSSKSSQASANEKSEKKALVAYFSATGNTKYVAENLAQLAGADLYEIKPQVPYTAEDLDWHNANSRSSIEMHDKAFRPALADNELNLANYDVIYLGFPIWWYVAPTIINTFLESHDFSGKTIIIFATSGGSDYGKTMEELSVSLPESTTLKEGNVFRGRASNAQVEAWFKSL